MRLTNEGMPTGQAEVLADEQISLIHSNFATKQNLANLATKADVAKCATREELGKCATKEDLASFVTKQEFAGLQTEVRTLKWIVASVGFGMVTVMLGMSSVVIKSFWTA